MPTELASPDQTADLTRTLVRLGAALGRATFTEAGLPLSDARALQLLDEARGEPISPGVLAKRLDLSPPAVTALVDRLVEAGLVERGRDPADRRRVQILLTARARALGARHLRKLAAVIDEEAAAVPAAHRAAVNTYLDGVTRRVADVLGTDA
jgi:DNA-binding MarR family transcriptional regulator